MMSRERQAWVKAILVITVIAFVNTKLAGPTLSANLLTLVDSDIVSL